jgi:hypothetical protein
MIESEKFMTRIDQAGKTAICESAQVYLVPQPSTNDYQRAFAGLDAIITSNEWLSEVGRSVENKFRRQRQSQ